MLVGASAWRLICFQLNRTWFDSAQSMEELFERQSFDAQTAAPKRHSNLLEGMPWSTLMMKGSA
jgi:hypothetical protein